MNVFGLREEAREPGENQCRHWENMLTPHREAPSQLVLNHELCCCEVPV